jgi:hypothetical protein
MAKSARLRPGQPAPRTAVYQATRGTRRVVVNRGERLPPTPSKGTGWKEQRRLP